jgi:hypothetical protein
MHIPWRRGAVAVALMTSTCAAEPSFAEDRTEMLKEAARLSYTNFCREVPPPPDPAAMQMLAQSPQAMIFAAWLTWINRVATARQERCRDS